MILRGRHKQTQTDLISTSWLMILTANFETRIETVSLCVPCVCVCAYIDQAAAVARSCRIMCMFTFLCVVFIIRIFQGSRKLEVLMNYGAFVYIKWGETCWDCSDTTHTIVSLRLIIVVIVILAAAVIAITANRICLGQIFFSLCPHCSFLP